MRLIIPRIPKKTTPSELKKFVRAGARSRLSILFTNQPQIVNAEVILIRDGRGQAEYCGLVTVLPDSAGQKVIRKLNGTTLNGKRVVVREYKERNQSGRVFDPLSDRRRPNLTIERAGQPRIEALEGFARDYSI